MKDRNIILSFFSLSCLALSSMAQAVSPAPDGGYSGFNTAEGQSALFGLTTGVGNAAVGWFSLSSNTDGSFNTGVGAAALLFNIGNQSTGEGLANTAIGTAALLNNITGSTNTATGLEALFSNTVGSDNTAIGPGALSLNTAGDSNTAVGAGALGNNITGSFNIALGVAAAANVTTASNVICIGTAGNDVDDSCYIGNIFDATSVNGVSVLVNSNGRLGTTTSSSRFKDDIRPMDKASEALYALKPISFRYKKKIDPQGISQFGLVAEDVEKVNPDLVVRDKEGRPYSVRYDQVNAMLLNEFLKAHRKMEEQEKQIEVLTAQLKEQAVQIQKVSTWPQTSKREQQIVATNQ